LYGLKKPGRYYAIVAGAGLAIFLGALLLSESLRALGYESMGSLLGTAVLLALVVYVVWSAISWARADLKRIDADIERQVLEERQRAELAWRKKRLKELAAIAARSAAKEEERQLQRQRQALKDAQTNTFVYFIVDWQRQVVKIGVSQSPQKRLAALQTSNPNPLELAAMIPGGYVPERQLHERYAAHRLNGEWFQLTQEIIDQIESFKARPAK
jgi:hypothetical protein